MTPVGSARYLIGPWYAGMYTFRTTRATDSAGLTPTPPHLTARRWTPGNRRRLPRRGGCIPQGEDHHHERRARGRRTRGPI